MKKIMVVIILSINLTACIEDPPSAVVISAPTRDLSQDEKVKVGRSISLTMKDPDAAKFYWLPVILVKSSDGSNNYCVYLNGKNSYGGYIGFDVIHVRLHQLPDGTFDSANDIIIDSSNDLLPRAHIACSNPNGYGRFAGPK